MDARTNREIVLSYLDLMAKGQIENALALTNDHYNFIAPDGRSMNKDELRELFAWVGPKFAGPLDQKIIGVTAEDDRVAVEATGSAPLVNGKTYNNAYHYIFNLKNGEICSVREYCDTRVLSLFDD